MKKVRKKLMTDVTMSPKTTAAKRVKRISLRGKSYALKHARKVDKTGRNIGNCSSPFEPNRMIMILKKLDGQRELDVYIHEMLHACFWDMSEEAINEASSDIAKALWRIGYRKIN